MTHSERLNALKSRLNMTELFRSAGLNPSTMRATYSTQKRELHEGEKAVLVRVLKEVRAELDEVIEEWST